MPLEKKGIQLNFQVSICQFSSRIRLIFGSICSKWCTNLVFDNFVENLKVWDLPSNFLFLQWMPMAFPCCFGWRSWECFQYKFTFKLVTCYAWWQLNFLSLNQMPFREMKFFVSGDSASAFHQFPLSNKNWEPTFPCYWLIRRSYGQLSGFE